jgi:small nuclear ribonucleoprotein (snRNP)-like protein
MQTPKDKALLCNTIIGIIKACEGKCIQIDLRNEIHVVGKIEAVSSDMNVTMSNAWLTVPFSSIRNNHNSIKYSQITIRGSNIRFVHVPDEVDMIEALQNQIITIKRGKSGHKYNKNLNKNKY